jgi:hypothetical protein
VWYVCFITTLILFNFNFPFNLLKLSLPDEGYVRSASCDELLVISNFSQKSPIEDINDGSLYLEFAYNPRSFYVIDEEEVPLNEEPEEPSPIPPRPSRH